MPRFTPHFQLVEPKSTTPTYVRLRLAYDNGKSFPWRLKDSLGCTLRIHPDLWDFDLQQPIPKSEIPKKYQIETKNLEIITELIHKIRDIVPQIKYDALKDKERGVVINEQYIMDALSVKLGYEKKKKGITLVDFCGKIVAEMENGTCKNESKMLYSRGTIRHFRVLHRHLTYFKPDTQFSDINQDWYNDFVDFCQQPKTIKDKEGNVIFTKEAAENSTISGKIKRLKRLMDFAISRNISDNKNHREKWFKKPTNAYETSKTDIYLSPVELRKIYDYQPLNKTEDIVRDLFLIGAYSGLRVSDYGKNITKDNFKTTDNGNLYLVKATQKTKKAVGIPMNLFPEFTSIVEKHNYILPKIADQTINRVIKEICRKIGFTEKVEYFIGKGGAFQTKVSEKWRLITTHVGRRSLISNLFRKGLSKEDIHFITGQTLEVVEEYIKLSAADNVDRVMDKFNQIKQKQND